MAAWAAALLALALLALALLAAPAGAQSERELYTVGDIEVDVTADDAVTARAQALDEGQREGLRRLLERLSAPADRGRLPDVGALPIERYARSFEIASEELSRTRYIANLTVSYEPRAVRGLLEDRGIGYTDTPSEQMLLLPVYESDGELRLWEDPNPWRDAWWRSALPRQSLVRLVLPLGDLQDVTTIDGDLAFRGDAEAIRRLAARYGVDQVFVARATAEPGAETDVLRLDVRRVSGDYQLELEDSLRGEPDDGEDELMAMAIARVIAALEAGFKDEQLLPSGPTSQLQVQVPLADLRDWVQMNEALRAMPEVREATLDGFARRFARVRLAYVGELLDLRSALARQGLQLLQEGEIWRLQPTMAGPGPIGIPGVTPPS